jgi:hypothetical protein
MQPLKSGQAIVTTDSTPSTDNSSEARGAAANKMPDTSFEHLATQSDPGIVGEFISFLKYNKKWWLTPILIILLLLGGLILLSGTAAAPFLYTLW